MIINTDTKKKHLEEKETIKKSNNRKARKL